jgi:hypothetical protein
MIIDVDRACHIPETSRWVESSCYSTNEASTANASGRPRQSGCGGGGPEGVDELLGLRRGELHYGRFGCEGSSPVSGLR